MGRVFLEHLGGTTVFHCGKCKTYLTNKFECMSDGFQIRATGPAFLFRRVVNINMGELEQRAMLTGKHVVRDVFCKQCKNKLGWAYEFACEPSQSYKEGHVILEKKLLSVVEESHPKLAETLPVRRLCISNSSSSIESSGLNSSDETVT